MTIGINASFLRKQGTGIGQVTTNFLRALTKVRSAEFFLYCEEEPALDFPLPKNFHVRVFLPLWKRDDLLRKMLWEKQVAREVMRDDCEAFLSLYQASTVMPKSIHHTMVVHDIIPRVFPEYLGNIRKKLFWHLTERGIQSADNIVAISEYTQQELISKLHVPKENITIAYPDVAPRFRQTVSEAMLQDVLKKYALTPGYIYHGGGLEIRKNVETLLRAYKQLTINNQQKTEDARQKIPLLVISGKIFPKGNPLATDVETLIQELHLEEKVKLLGFVPDEDLPALYRGAVFFVYPSLVEGFGLPVLEALSLGVPVLSSETSSLPEVGGKAVLYTDPNNVEQMAVQMERLLIDTTLRSSLVAQSTSQAIQFNWEAFVKKVLVCCNMS